MRRVATKCLKFSLGIMGKVACLESEKPARANNVVALQDSFDGNQIGSGASEIRFLTLGQAEVHGFLECHWKTAGPCQLFLSSYISSDGARIRCVEPRKFVT